MVKAVIVCTAAGNAALYVVQPGDTPAAIAFRFGIPLAALRAANPQVPDPFAVVPGEIIVIPVNAVPPCPPVFDRRRYVVQQNDTLVGIAQRFGVTPRDLEDANPLAAAIPGLVLIIPPPPTFGIDVSQLQGLINWPLVRQSGVRFAFIKAAEGREFRDSLFVENVRGARAVGIPTGGYHFARPDLNPTPEGAGAEADNFIAALQTAFGSGCFGDLLPVLDLEEPFPPDPRVITTTQLLDWADAFRIRFENRTGVRLMLFTGIHMISAYDNFNAPVPGNPLVNMPLWIAMWTYIPGNPPFPPVPPLGGWSRWTVWQFTDRGRINGITGFVDLDFGPINLSDIAV